MAAAGAAVLLGGVARHRAPAARLAPRADGRSAAQGARAGTQPAPRAAPPNVLLIVTDDQGWWDLGVHGNRAIETPVLDGLAREGVRFSRFYASPVCTPTRAALLTGRHYQRTGAYDTYMGRDAMRPDEVTLAERLRTAGYRTGLVGKWHLGRYMRFHPNAQGFDEFFGFWQYGFINDYVDSDELWRDKRRVQSTGYVTDVLTDQALGFLERNRARPFFLYLAYNAPHHPYLVPDRYTERYLKKGLPLREAQIYGMVTSLDENVGRVLARLDTLGLRENTLVVFMSDNGGVSRHTTLGLRGGKGSVYEGGVRVPFFARLPGRFPAGAVVDAMAQDVDVLPTVLDLVGAPLPAAAPPAALPQVADGRVIDGRSLLPLLRRGGGESPHAFLFHQWNRVRPVMDLPAHVPNGPMPNGGVPSGGRPATADGGGAEPNWAVRDRRGWKLVATGSRETGATRYQLFDLAADSGETRDVASAHPGLVRDLRARFARWFGEVTAGQDYRRRAVIEVGRADENPVELDLLWAEPGRRATPAYHEYNRDVVEGWTEPGDSIHWRVDVVRSGRYEVLLSYGSAPEDAGSTLRVSAGHARLEHVVQGTSGRRVFQTFRAGTLPLGPGPGTVAITAATAAGRDAVALHKVWLRRLDDAAETTTTAPAALTTPPGAHSRPR